MIPRKIMPQMEEAIRQRNKKIILLWGARQTGKSTILSYLHKKYGGAFFTFDDFEDQRLFVPELHKLTSAIAQKAGVKDVRFVFIDEIQQYPESTQSVKLLADQSDTIIVATGSSELRAKTHRFDTLAGRYAEFVLFPLTLDELARFHSDGEIMPGTPNHAQTIHLTRYLEELLTYGSYPGVILSHNKIEELKNITQNSVVKDIVAIYDLKNADLVYTLLRLLAMQIGNLFNVTELASSLGSSKITIDNYLSILAKNRIIFFIDPFRTNKRRGYLGRKKVFFTDLGVRNTLIGDFRPIHLRQDLGAVFENAVVAGVLRQTYYRHTNESLFYFRDVAGKQKEIDLIVQTPEGKRQAWEIKYTGGQPNIFASLNIARYGVISRDNAATFLV